MVISGLQNTTLLDYPGHVAATIFLGGCNYRCPFCHNADIVLNPWDGLNRDKLMAFLKKRKGVLDGVCITGGEPTLQKDLGDFLTEIKSMGLLIKLDTNGSNPYAIREAVQNKLVDYIAMDIKTSLENYGFAIGIDGYDTTNIEESINYIMECGIEYEFRTTLVKGIHTYKDMSDIVNRIRGAKAYYLQSYRDNDITMEKLKTKEAEAKNSSICSEFTNEELLLFLNIAKEGIPEAQLRGVDIK